MITINKPDFDKLCIAARYWLLSKTDERPEYNKVLEAFELGLEHHDGQRNGGQPEFIHQLQIFHRLRTLHRHIKNPALVYTLVFLHDAIEDARTDAQGVKHYISLEEIDSRFGSIVADKLRKLSKEIMGVKNPDYSLDVIFADEDCAIAKSGDRADNVSTMFGVFKAARLERYVKETIEEFLPRMKLARRTFPHQEGVFENIKLELVNQLQLIQHLMSYYEQTTPADATQG